MTEREGGLRWTRKTRHYFVRCGVDGFINWSRAYGRFASALDAAQRLDRFEKCGPHTVVSQDWITNASDDK